jgi:hypothetical protein
MVAKFMSDMATRRFRPSPPLSEPAAETADPKRTLGTHPDIIEAIWVHAELKLKIFPHSPALISSSPTKER